MDNVSVDDEARKKLSKTIKELKISRKALSETMRNLKEEQTDLQTALAKAKNLTATAGFRINKLQQYGSGSLAYSSLQAGLKYHMHDELGYVSYVPLSAREPGSVLVLSDPICHRDHLRALIDDFMTVRKDPIFIHINHSTACVLADLGFSVNELGIETVIEIQDFELTGNKKQQLRSARNRAKKDDIKVRELHSVDDAFMTALKAISDDWIAGKVASDQQMKFVVRPMVYVDEIDVRRFIAIKDDKIVGFVIFDPMYENGEVIGYIANQLRSNYEGGFSVVDFIILEAMEVFKAEGKKDLSLGLSPMAKVDDGQEFKHSKLLKAHFKYNFERANYLYNFKNLARHKNQYRPDSKGAREEKVYCAMRTRFFLSRMYGVYTALGLKPIQSTMRHLKEVGVEKLRSLFGKKTLAINGNPDGSPAITEQKPEAIAQKSKK